MIVKWAIALTRQSHSRHPLLHPVGEARKPFGNCLTLLLSDLGVSVYLINAVWKTNV